jgi:hypothetical protein
MKVAKEAKRLVSAHTKFSSFAKATDDTTKQAPFFAFDQVIVTTLRELLFKIMSSCQAKHPKSIRQ